MVSCFLFTLLLIANTELDYGNSMFWSIYLYISLCLALRPRASFCCCSNKWVKGLFSFKGKTAVGRNGSNYQLLHKLNPGLCTDCLCVSVGVCVWVLWGQMFKCTPVNRGKKGSADCSHVWYVNLYFLFIWSCLEVLMGKVVVTKKRFSSCLKAEFWMK